MNVVGDFMNGCDFGLLNFQLPPLNHTQTIEDILALAATKTDRNTVIIVLCQDKTLREVMNGIGVELNKGRSVFDRIPVVVANPKRKNWQEKVVGFCCDDVFVFAEKEVLSEDTNWVVDIYGTRK